MGQYMTTDTDGFIFSEISSEESIESSMDHPRIMDSLPSVQQIVRNQHPDNQSTNSSSAQQAIVRPLMKSTPPPRSANPKPRSSASASTPPLAKPSTPKPMIRKPSPMSQRSSRKTARSSKSSASPTSVLPTEVSGRLRSTPKSSKKSPAVRTTPKAATHSATTSTGNFGHPTVPELSAEILEAASEPIRGAPDADPSTEEVMPVSRPRSSTPRDRSRSPNIYYKTSPHRRSSGKKSNKSSSSPSPARSSSRPSSRSSAVNGIDEEESVVRFDIVEPSDLHDAKATELRELAQDVGVNSRGTKYELIGRILTKFPSPVVSDDLKSFSVVQLREMCHGVGVNSQGRRAEIIPRLIEEVVQQQVRDQANMDVEESESHVEALREYSRKIAQTPQPGKRTRDAAFSKAQTERKAPAKKPRVSHAPTPMRVSTRGRSSIANPPS